MKAYIRIRITGTLSTLFFTKDAIDGLRVLVWPTSSPLPDRIISRHELEKKRRPVTTITLNSQGYAEAELELKAPKDLLVTVDLDPAGKTQILLGVIGRDDWETGMGVLSTFKDWSISPSTWCQLTSARGRFLICGQVRDAYSNPLRGFIVSAWDLDLLSKNDPLGTTLTDMNGCFKLVYYASDFQEKLGWLRAERLADVFFQVAQSTPTGPVVVYRESPAQARKNVPPCLCVELVIDPIRCPDSKPPPPRKAILISSTVEQPLTVPGSGPQGPVRGDEFSIVGVYDVDWLLEPRFERLLDFLAASPGAFKTLRFFGALSSGALEDKAPPSSSGTVWSDASNPTTIDFSRTFRALEALTSRGLVPYVVLSFFPAAVSNSPIEPPSTFDNWKVLVRAFLDQLAVDARFGQDTIRNWWFEVWNEPNLAQFWNSNFDRYLSLYEATSEAVVASGHEVQLGGPAIAYIPRGGRETMEEFLNFVSDHPQVKCDFISLHRKGAFGSDEPDINRPINAAEETANLALTIDAARFRGLPIVNSEADMKAGFDNPYMPRMDQRFPAWLSGVMIAYDALSSQFRNDGFRFIAAADDANQQLVDYAFDGKRSIMTAAGWGGEKDLYKVPVYNFYEILRLLGDRHGTFITGGDLYYPNSSLFHAITVADTHIGSIFSIYPYRQGFTAESWSLNYSIQDIGWERINIARFQIDEYRSNGFHAAGGPWTGGATDLPFTPDGGYIRDHQELSVFSPIQRDVALPTGRFSDTLLINPHEVIIYWLTPFTQDVPAAPTWIEGRFGGIQENTTLLRWEPTQDPQFYTYEVLLIVDGKPPQLLSPMPLRSAIWIETWPLSLWPWEGTRTYAVRTVTASGVGSDMIMTTVTL